MRKIIWTKKYEGFEDLYDLEKDIEFAFEYEMKDLPEAFTGTLIVTIEYDEEIENV